MAMPIVLLALVLTSEDLSGAQSAISQLRKAIEANQITQMEVYFLPYDVTTRSRVDPSDLRFKDKAPRRVAVDGEVEEAIVLALRHTELGNSDVAPDIRWGIVFFDAAGNEQHAVFLDGRYIDGTGRRGIVNGRTVATNGALGMWLELQYPDLLRITPDDAVTGKRYSMQAIGVAHDAVRRNGIDPEKYETTVRAREAGGFTVEMSLKADGYVLGGLIVVHVDSHGEVIDVIQYQ